MKRSDKKIDKEELLQIVKKASAKTVSVCDVTDEFSNDDLYVYDCRLSSKDLRVGILDVQGKLEMVKLKDTLLIDDEAALIISGIANKIEDEIRLATGFDCVTVDYEPYTFLDYKYEIKFVLLVDFSGAAKSSLRIKRKKIAYAQQSGKSKYLN